MNAGEGISTVPMRSICPASEVALNFHQRKPMYPIGNVVKTPHHAGAKRQRKIMRFI
jgi:hypothetical protein